MIWVWNQEWDFQSKKDNLLAFLRRKDLSPTEIFGASGS